MGWETRRVGSLIHCADISDTSFYYTASISNDSEYNNPHLIFHQTTHAYSYRSRLVYLGDQNVPWIYLIRLHDFVRVYIIASYIYSYKNHVAKQIKAKEHSYHLSRLDLHVCMEEGV